MRPERDDTDVRGVVEVVLGEHLPKPLRREEVALRRGSKLEVAQDTVYISVLYTLLKPKQASWC